MEDLLTTRQVLEYLKVDRITVYRMLNDGRLKGIKIGQHWRFPRSEVERLVNGAPSTEERRNGEPPTAGRRDGDTQPEPGQAEPSSSFPTHCAQTIQDLYSEVSQISALIVDLDGEPLTEITHPCDFCRLVLQSPEGQKACRETWRRLASGETASGGVFTCHAGLQYLSAPVVDKGRPAARFLSGQFYWQAPEPGDAGERLRTLAQDCGLPVEPLQQAASRIPLVLPEQQAQVAVWPQAAARAVQGILHERTGFMTRLQQIANLSQIP